MFRKLFFFMSHRHGYSEAFRRRQQAGQALMKVSTYEFAWRAMITALRLRASFQPE